MRRVKVTGYQRRSRGFGVRVGILRILDLCSMMIRGLLPLLPFIMIGVLFLLPETPHLRVSYLYSGSYDSPRYITCRYLGIYGWRTVRGNHCPVVTLLNGKRSRREFLRRPGEYHRAAFQAYRETW